MRACLFVRAHIVPPFSLLVTAISTGVGCQEGAYKSYGTINTGYIPNLRSCSNADKKKVIAERNKQGVKLGGGKGNIIRRSLRKIYYEASINTFHGFLSNML